MNSDSTTLTSKPINYKSKIIFSVKLVITVLLSIYIISYVQLQAILDSISHSNILFLSLSLILLIPNIYLQYLKWQLTCRQLLDENDNSKIIISLFYGFPPAVFTPARTGEYVGRALAFKDRPFVEIIIATFIDKLYVILVTFLLGAIGAFLFIRTYYQSDNFVSIPFLITFLALAAFAIVLLFANEEWMFNKVSSILKFKFLLQIREKLLILKKTTAGYSLKMFLVSILFLLCYLLQFMLLICAFSNHFDLLNYFWAALVIMFTKSILSPITIGELGIREGAAVFFLTQMGELSSTALNASLALFFINIIIPSLISLSLLFLKNDE